MPSRRLSTGTLVVLCAALLPVSAAPPQIVRITPPALQPGIATTLTIDGADLVPNPRLFLPVPIVTQIVKGKPAVNRVQIEVKLADSIPPGLYPLRLASDKGISNAL